MPMIPKAFHNYPPNTDTPINAAALAGLEQRVGNYVGASMSLGPGVAGYEDFRVKTHGGGDMTQDVGVPNVLMAAYVALDALGSIQRFEYSGAQLNVAFAASDPTNPRIDRVVLVPGLVDSAAPSVVVLTGTPTGGATLDNLSGAQAVTAGRLLLADVLVAAGATSLAGVARDRRLVAPGVTPWSGNAGIDAATLIPHPGHLLAIGNVAITTTNFQYAAAMSLPRRIVGATRMRWKYLQSGSAITGNYNLGIFDASGRQIVSTGAVAFTGAATSIQTRAEVIAATTFEAGWYYVMVGLASLAVGTAVFFGPNIGNTNGSFSPVIPGIGYVTGAGGTTLPTAMQNWSGSVDEGNTGGTTTPAVVPVVALTVG